MAEIRTESLDRRRAKAWFEFENDIPEFEDDTLNIETKETQNGRKNAGSSCR